MILRALARLASPLAVLALGCSSPSRPATSPAGTSAPSAPSGQRVFVWVTGGDNGSPSTYSLSPGGDVLAHMDGVHVLAAGTDWTTVVTTEAVTTQACRESNGQPAGQGRAVRVRLEPADPSRKPLEIVSPGAADEANDFEQSARLLASIGPYVFIEDTTYAYTCGAHGNTGVSFAVWNVDEGRTVDLVSDLPDRASLLQRGKAAVDAEPDTFDFSRPEDPPTITELVPRLDEAGRLHASALVTVPSCYACTRGGWSSYTASAEVTAQLPWRLRALGPPPAAVTAFLARHAAEPGFVVGGYSVSEGPRSPSADRARSTAR